ncbi:MAG: DUF1566 domain-containing protein [Desulfocapsaceae bacterium]|nr:DUF1566 domain-containing protein [Desulfocapsaceae bacterium]
MHQKLQVGNRTISPIDWEMTPDLSFGTYESWGGRERVRNNDERIYYFFVDAWGKKPKVCLMERGIKHAKVLAEIEAPADMVNRCVNSQGSSHRRERSFAIDEAIKTWLIETVLDGGDNTFVRPIVDDTNAEDMGPDLPMVGTEPFASKVCTLPSEPAIISEEQAVEIITREGFFDTFLNNQSRGFQNALARTQEPQVVVDERTGLMWQRGGIDITSIRTMQQRIKDLNTRDFAGFNDWRLPTLEEAMSLLEPLENAKGLHLHPCFSKDQPFIFVAAQRKPGGYWFVDFKHGRAFFSSGTIPGGFGRLVRTMTS